jgi:hypothetical protein
MRLRTGTGTSQATATQSAKARDQPEAPSRAAEPAAWAGVVVAETRPRIDVQEMTDRIYRVGPDAPHRRPS